MFLSILHKSIIPFLSKGSPPVKRIFLMPKEVNDVTISTIRSKEMMSLCSFFIMPSLGIQ